MKKWNRILNSVMITFISVTIVRFIVDYVDLLILRPEVYAVRSAPWYVGGLLYGAITAVLILLCLIIKAILKIKVKRAGN